MDSGVMQRAPSGKDASKRQPVAHFWSMSASSWSLMRGTLWIRRIRTITFGFCSSHVFLLARRLQTSVLLHATNCPVNSIGSIPMRYGSPTRMMKILDSLSLSDA
ncbi:hypothetical protein BDW69DRAFT_156174 [Aspergillus filifer]